MFIPIVLTIVIVIVTLIFKSNTIGVLLFVFAVETTDVAVLYFTVDD